jgi:hypothetical protein
MIAEARSFRNEHEPSGVMGNQLFSV